MKTMNHILCLIVSVIWVQESACEKRCSAPTLANGWVEATGPSHPDYDIFTGKLRCNSGFTLVGLSDTIKCRSGIWSVRPSNFPVCTAIGTCPDLPEIENGHKKTIRGFRNSVFKYRCNRGYRLYGAKKMYCTGSQWSSKSLPVCTKSGCDEELVSKLRHGGSRKMLKGGVYRFRCDKGSVMEGPNVIVCDGFNWNETAPICLTPPTPPHLELQVEGSPINAAQVGQTVTVLCESQRGSPVPVLQLTKNGEIVGKVETASNSYSFVMEKSDEDSVFQCSATNKMVESPVMSQQVSLRQNYAPTEVILSGDDIANRGDMVKFECSSESHPNPQITWIIMDQDSKLVDAQIEDIAGGKSIAVFNLKDNAKAYSVQCTASNGIGEMTQSKTIHVRYLPKSITMDGPWEPAPKLVSSDATSVFNCSSFSSYPAATISWKVDFAGDGRDLHDQINTNNRLLLLEDGSWMTTSSLTIPAIGTSHPSFTIQCVASVDGLIDSKMSEPHTVMVTYGSGYVSVEGDEEVDVNTDVAYTCKTGPSYPAGQLEWSATDQDGLDVAISVAPTETNPEGEVSSTATMRVEHKHQRINIVCTASNSVGSISNQKSIKVYTAPTSVSIIGPEMVETGETAEYKCMSDLSSPRPQFKWEVTGYQGETIDVTDLGFDGDEETEWSRISFTADRSQKIVRITCTASNKLGSVSHIQQVAVQYGPESLKLVAPESVGASDETEVRCSSSESVPAADIVWTVIINGQEVKLDQDETEQVPTLMEDGGVSTYSTIRLPALGSATAIVKCRSIGTWKNYEELVQEQTIVVKGPPGEPLIAGLRDGAEVAVDSEHVLTCSAEIGSPPATLRWFRGQEEADFVELEVHGGNVIATWKYVAKEGDEELRCEASNEVTEEPSVGTVKIDVSKTIEVHLQSENEQEQSTDNKKALEDTIKNGEEYEIKENYDEESEIKDDSEEETKKYVEEKYGIAPEYTPNAEEDYHEDDENYEDTKEPDFYKVIEEERETPSAPESNPKSPAMKSSESRKPMAEAVENTLYGPGNGSIKSSSISSLIIMLAVITKLLL